MSVDSVPVPKEPAQLVVQFLESIGRRSDAKLYLKLFRELPKHRFAVLAPRSTRLQDPPLPLLEPLRFLAALGLYPVVALNGFDAQGTSREEHQPDESSGLAAFAKHLKDFEIGYAHVEWRVGQSAAAFERNAGAGLISLVNLANANSGGTTALGALVSALKSRKLVVLRSRGGIGPSDAGRLSLTSGRTIETHGEGVSLLNLRADYDALRTSDLLDHEEQHLLTELHKVHAAAPSLLTNITSPLNLLRELFTVRGAGTLVTTGSDIRSFNSYEEANSPRLRKLLEKTFDRKLAADFFERPPKRVYLESEYRGAAIVVSGFASRVGYLTKFAVSRAAQGEGLGRDLWDALESDQPSVYWRARRDNPSANWYSKRCDGMHAAGDWRVYWRNLNAEDIPALVRDALSRPEDLLPSCPQTVLPSGLGEQGTVDT